MSHSVGGLSNTLQGDMSGCNASPIFITDAQCRHAQQGVSDSCGATSSTPVPTPQSCMRRGKSIALRARASVVRSNVFWRFENDALWRQPPLNLRAVRAA
jgi:hypothetical protein